MLHEVVQFSKRVTQAYDDYTFNRGMTVSMVMLLYPNAIIHLATHHIQNFTTNDLSAFYFDVIKDRLYNDQPNSPSRRSAQTVLYHILRAYTSSFAPFACHTAEEIYENYKAMTPHPESSVFKQGWFSLVSYREDISGTRNNALIIHIESQEPQWHNAELEIKWSVLKQLKAQVNQVLELARQDK